MTALDLDHLERLRRLLYDAMNRACALSPTRMGIVARVNSTDRMIGLYEDAIRRAYDKAKG